MLVFYYETVSGSTSGIIDANPGNNFGDSGNGPWIFCWTISTTTNCGPASNDLSISINTTSDYESGAWISAGCVGDVNTTFAGNINCCISTVSFTPVSCFNGSDGTATATPGLGGVAPFTYNWTPTGQLTQTATNLSAGQYIVNVTDVNGCLSTDTTIVTQPTQLLVPTSQVNETCFGQSIGTATVNPSGGTPGYSYLWTSLQITSTISSLPIGIYTVTVTDANSCTSTTSVTITEPPMLIPTYTTTTLNGCEPFGITYTNTTLNTSSVWTINGTQYNSNPLSQLYSAGVYNTTLTVTDINGCVGTSPLIVSNVYPLPIASFTPSPYTTSIATPTINFDNLSSGGSSYLWNFGDGYSSTDQFPSHVYNNTGSFTILLTVTTSNGCIDTTYQSIFINELFTVYIPNTFTPNGDGRNDYFGPITQGVKSYSFDVFNRWGERIFSTEAEQPWDGTYQGKIVKQDVYTWKIVLTDDLNKVHEYMGNVTCLSNND